MEYDKVSPRAKESSKLFCLFVLIGIILFTIFNLELDYSLIEYYSNLIFAIVFVIVIFAVIVFIIGANREKNLPSAQSHIQKPQTPVNIHILNTKEEEISQTSKNLILYCEYCGEKISKDSNFCHQCGIKLM